MDYVQYSRLGSDQQNSFVLVFAPDEPIVDGIMQFARAEGVRAARLSAIGGFSKAVLGYFSREHLSYEHVAVDEQVELLSLIGDIATKDGERLLHAHVVVGHRDGHTTGGHLISATVWPTVELFADVYSTPIVKKQRAELGIATIELDSSDQRH